MDIKPIPKEDITYIKENLKNICLSYYLQNRYKIHKLHEGQREIAKLLNKYDLYMLIYQGDSQVKAEIKIIQYLNECEKLTELMDIVAKYNWSLEETEKYFDAAKDFIINLVDIKTATLQYQIKGLSQKGFSELMNK